MYTRSANILKSNSFFLFGARGTGKTTLLRELFADSQPIWIDLLSARDEQKYSTNPDRLIEEISASNRPAPEWIVIDEVQKVPKLLDIAHLLIEEKKIKFALTGSSARKLKRGAANLLAGRAYVNYLYPLTHRELGEQFNLNAALTWGTLPKVTMIGDFAERSVYLETYAHTFLKEEILAEQLVRSITPFRKFLELAGQTSGQIVNYRKIASEIGGDPKSVKKYYEILEDTLVGVFLPAFSKSLRKQQRTAPKFYLFDVGIRRAIENVSQQQLTESTYEYGRAFEEFIILEAFRLNSYGRKNFKLSFLRTDGDAEIDLIVERPGVKSVLVEIKSSSAVQERHLRHLAAFKMDYPEFDAICLCREERARKCGDITIFPWKEGLKEIGF